MESEYQPPQIPVDEVQALGIYKAGVGLKNLAQVAEAFLTFLTVDILPRLDSWQDAYENIDKSLERLADVAEEAAK